MHFANFRFSMALSKKISAWPMALLLGLWGCGYQGSAERSTFKDDSVGSALSFASWCESWTILCDSEPAPSTGSVALDAKKWAALTSVANEALANTIALNVTRAEIDSPELSLAFEKLGLVSELNKLKTTLDLSQWQSIGLEGKSLVSRSTDYGTANASNGLSFNAGPALTLSLGDNSTVKVDGLSLSSDAAGKTSELKTIALGEGNSLNIGLASETVQNVPFQFLEESLVSAFGFEDVLTESVEITNQQIISAAYPLLSWANKPQRTIALNRNFFAVATTELAPVLGEEDFGPALLNVLSALNSFATSATAGKNVVHLAQVSGAKLECNVNNGEAKAMFDKEFGLKRFYQVDGGIGLEFFGVRATARLALGIPLTLKRIELRGNKITILDIPIIGKIDIDLDQLAGSGDEETVFACAK